MILKVLGIEETPNDCTRRVVLRKDDMYQNWVRDEYDHTFLLWSNSENHHGDRVFNRRTKKMDEVDSPFEPVLDGDGYETGESKPRDGLLIIPVDVYEHSGMVWFLRGEAPAGCACRWDSTCYNREAPFYLYCDKQRWDSLCGNCEWKFEDGKPSDELMQKAREVARDEIRMMNLCEEGSYFGYSEEEKVTEESDVVIVNEHDGSRKAEHRKSTSWDEVESCWGFLTDKPAREVDFPLGCPVVTDYDYLEGDTFEQECYALADEHGRYVKFRKDGHDLVDEAWKASLYAKRFLDDKLKHYEEELGAKLSVTDVTSAVWSRYPECVLADDITAPSASGKA